MPDETEPTTGELYRSLQRIERAVSTLESEVRGLAAGFVSRSEWDLANKSMGREIAELKASRAPWWTWVSLVIAGTSLLLVISSRVTL